MSSRCRSRHRPKSPFSPRGKPPAKSNRKKDTKDPSGAVSCGGNWRSWPWWSSWRRGGGFYFFRGQVSRQFSSFGKYVEEKAVSLKKVSLNLPFLKKYLGLGDSREGYISLEKVKGYYLESNTLNKIFVIEGEAVNHWKESRSFIKVKGVLLDSGANKVQEKEVYSGNILSEKDLKEMSKVAVDKSLYSQFGISFSNVNIQPGKSVPFMIVFMDLPPDRGPGKPAAVPAAKPGEGPARLSDFTVEVVGSQKGSK